MAEDRIPTLSRLNKDMSEVVEVGPVSWRVVCLNAPHLKSLCVFQALSSTLGCCYNHHRPQVVRCETTVRLPTPRMTRVRGHTSHTLPLGPTPTLHTLLQIGTYMVFHLADWTQVDHCHLVLHGIEKIPRSHSTTPVILQRIDNDHYTTTPLTTRDGSETTQTSSSPASAPLKLANSKEDCTKVVPPITDPSTDQDQLHSTSQYSQDILSTQTCPNTDTIICHTTDQTGINNHITNLTIDYTTNHTSTIHHNTNQMKATTINHHTNTNTSTLHHISNHTEQSCPTRTEWDSCTKQITTPPNLRHDRGEGGGRVKWVEVNMAETEEIVTLLDDDDPEDDECLSDTSDDLHKVVARRLSVDMTSLLTPPPSDQVLVLLLRPASPPPTLPSPASPPASSLAWQFQSACIKVSLANSRKVMRTGSGTLKKTLTRTKPLYFSKNGNAHRL